MARPISYEMQMMFVGSSGAFEAASNTGSGISRLDFVQSYDFSFDVERTPLRQLGTGVFATTQTQFAPDVNLNIQYLLNDGWNEKYLGLDLFNDQSGNPFNSILNSTGDRNFYVTIAQNEGRDQNAQTGLSDNYVLGIGNAYITNYSISIGVGQLATASCSFVGANANIQNYSSSKYLPSVETLVSGANAEAASGNFSMAFIDNSRSTRYLSGFKDVLDGACPYSKCIVTPTFTPTGSNYPITFGFFDSVRDNFQNLEFSVQFERKSLYGFGNNYPYIRKIQKPTIATLTLSSLVDDFQAENIAKIFEGENAAEKSVLVEFFNLNNVKKFELKLENLTLASYSLGAQIGDRVLVNTSWNVEVKDNSDPDIFMSGSFGTPTLYALYTNESLNI